VFWTQNSAGTLGGLNQKDISKILECLNESVFY
jgi:hypothetical protein